MVADDLGGVELADLEVGWRVLEDDLVVDFGGFAEGAGLAVSFVKYGDGLIEVALMEGLDFLILPLHDGLNSFGDGFGLNSGG